MAKATITTTNRCKTLLLALGLAISALCQGQESKAYYWGYNPQYPLTSLASSVYWPIRSITAYSGKYPASYYGNYAAYSAPYLADQVLLNGFYKPIREQRINSNQPSNQVYGNQIYGNPAHYQPVYPVMNLGQQVPVQYLYAQPQQALAKATPVQPVNNIFSDPWLLNNDIQPKQTKHSTIKPSKSKSNKNEAPPPSNKQLESFIKLVNDKYDGNMSKALFDPNTRSFARTISLIGPDDMFDSNFSNQHIALMQNIMKDQNLHPASKLETIRVLLKQK